MSEQPWRYRCPEGHVIHSLGRGTFYCQSCGRSRPKDEMIDLASENGRTVEEVVADD